MGAIAPWSREEDLGLREALADGLSYRQVSSELQCRSVSAVIARTRKLGLEVRSQMRCGRPRKAANMQIADAVTIGTPVNTLVVSAAPDGDGAWTLTCRFDRTQTSASTADILSGAAVCPVCRPVRA